jgi:hypothetical protein
MIKPEFTHEQKAMLEMIRAANSSLIADVHEEVLAALVHRE